MDWRITDSAQKKRVVLMASRESHCLADLLHRWHSDELDCDIACVISNHGTCAAWSSGTTSLTTMFRWTRKTKEPAFAEVSRLVGHHQADVVVLARYMQILPPQLCREYAHQVINIHHSFLPSFVGAKPYHQASLRGVKLIGATCHYVTEELDAGPIIEQDVVRVSHRDSIENMVRFGRDVEKMVLARGLRAHGRPRSGSRQQDSRLRLIYLFRRVCRAPDSAVGKGATRKVTANDRSSRQSHFHRSGNAWRRLPEPL